jgi:hypothetical protein
MRTLQISSGSAEGPHGKVIFRSRTRLTANSLKNGAQGRNRTTDTAIFSRMLYQLSYLGTAWSPLGGA